MAHYLVNVASPVGVWGIEGTAEALVRIRMPDERGRATSAVAPGWIDRLAQRLGAYFAGERREFAPPFADVEATPFQRDVWAALCAIPYGEVRTYAEVAAMVAKPRAARAVGNANHANPWPVVVPCHRVVAAQGLGGYGGGEHVKRFLLELEGVPIVRNHGHVVSHEWRPALTRSSSGQS